MKPVAFISRIRDGIVIFLFLALCALLIAGISANYIVIFGIFGYLPFMLGAAIVLLLAFGDLIWCALQTEGSSRFSDFANMGAFAGFACSIPACALMLAAPAFSSGVALLLQGRETGAAVSVIVLCTLMGWIAGAAAFKAMPAMIDSAKAEAKATWQKPRMPASKKTRKK